jgi:hypothetical protein
MLFSIHCEIMTKISYLILRTDIVEVLPVGYQVTSLLGALLWKSVDYYLRPPFMSEVTSVVLVWSQCVRGVMGHTPLACQWHISSPSGRTVTSRGFLGTGVRSDSCTPE